MSQPPVRSLPNALEFESGAAQDRLDSFVCARLQEIDGYRQISRSQVKNMIEAGAVAVNSKPELRAGVRVKAGSLVSVSIESGLLEQNEIPQPLDFPLEILHEDERLLVINKPPNLTVHPGAGNRSNTLVNALVHHFAGKQASFESLLSLQGRRAGVVHRLDKDTSGVLVVAKDVQAHAFLAQQFAARSIGREYIALAYASPKAKSPLRLEEHGLIDAPIGRHPLRRKEMAVVTTGKTARTRWEVIQRLEYAILLKLKLETGRTHQIRVHMKHLGAAIIGDKVYGNLDVLPKPLRLVAERFGRQALHAGMLEFEHPDGRSGRLHFEAELPADFRVLISDFGGDLECLK